MKRFPCLEQPLKCYLNLPRRQQQQQDVEEEVEKQDQHEISNNNDAAVVEEPPPKEVVGQEGQGQPKRSNNNSLRTSINGSISELLKKPPQRQRLAVNRNGSLSLTPRRSAHAEFILLPCKQDSTYTVLVKSAQQENRYLRRLSEENDVVVASPLEEEDLESFQWKLEKKKTTTHHQQKQQQQGDENYGSTTSSIISLTLISGDSRKTLMVSENNAFCVQQVSVEKDNMESSVFALEFLSGELLFVGCNNNHSFIRCDVLGQLAMTDTCKGWEVWRFVEVGDQKHCIRIASWMHQRYLSVDESTGRVYTTVEPGTCFQVEKATLDDDNDGVVLRTASSGWLLAMNHVDKTLNVIPSELTTHDTVWQLEAAHSQTYSLVTAITPGDEKGATTTSSLSIGPLPYVTKQQRRADAIRIEQVANNVVTLGCQNQHLGINDNAVITLSEAPYAWRITVNTEDGTYSFQCKETDRYLSVRTTTVNSSILEPLLVPPTEESSSQSLALNEEEEAPTETTTTLSERRGIMESSVAAEEQSSSADRVEKQSTESPRPAVDTKPSLSTIDTSSSVEESTTARQSVKQGPAASLRNSFSSFVAKYKKEEESVLVLSLSDEPHPWRLEPVLPRAISSKKICAFAVGTIGLEVATTVAMPFVCAGVIGLIGAGEAGLLANAVVATLTGAEAVASVGVVGATAAICFRQDAISLMGKLEEEEEDAAAAASESDDNEDFNGNHSSAYSKRPFCDWRMW